MTINLSKGQRIDLTKGNPGLKKVIVGLGWETNRYSGGYDFDLDASAFLLGSNDKALNEKDFIFYNNLEGPNKCVVHTGDDLTGGSGGDDEQIIVDFTKMPDHVKKIAFTVTIHDAEQRAQNFGQVSNAFVRLVNAETNEEILRYNLAEEFSIETALVFCEIYRNGNDWKFNAVGSGFFGGLAALCKNYGLQAG